MAAIVIVDDHKDLLEIIADAFQFQGHTTIKCCNGYQAVEVLRSSPVDLMITDIIMPEKEGLELIREVRQTHPDLPIVAISGGNTEGKFSYLKIAEVFGACETFNKPLNLPQFVESVESILSEKTAS